MYQVKVDVQDGVLARVLVDYMGVPYLFEHGFGRHFRDLAGDIWHWSDEGIIAKLQH